ncbi:MAG: shikimate dehydrogenase [Pseudolabrys sp.]|nr:shikimate dehydrogenase [Pseudolabrys sp.]
MQKIRLGLIGDNIAASRAPHLHRAAGELCGIEVTYDLMVPKVMGLDFDAVFERARAEGYRGLNITYPYKECVVPKLAIDDASVRAIGACNTALFDGGLPRGANTDHTGFISAYRGAFGQTAPGKIAMAGGGGVGRAIAFALVKLGATRLVVFDVDRDRAAALIAALKGAAPQFDAQVAATIDGACESAEGLLNCTPAGMVGYGGTAFPESAYRGRRWAFDAVYTPIDTPFLEASRRAGLATMSGYELYFWQGVDAFRLFAGHDVDASALRKAIEPVTGLA